MADITVTAANVRLGSGYTTTTGTSGEAITVGQLVSLDSGDSKYYLADANSGTSERKKISGVAVSAASAADQRIMVQTGGQYNPGGTVVVGTIYVMSATAGGIAPSTDLASGHTVSIFGVGYTSSLIQICAGTLTGGFNSTAAVP